MQFLLGISDENKFEYIFFTSPGLNELMLFLISTTGNNTIFLLIIGF